MEKEIGELVQLLTQSPDLKKKETAFGEIVLCSYSVYTEYPCAYYQNTGKNPTRIDCYICSTKSPIH